MSLSKHDFEIFTSESQNVVKYLEKHQKTMFFRVFGLLKHIIQIHAKESKFRFRAPLGLVFLHSQTRGIVGISLWEASFQVQRSIKVKMLGI